MSRPPRVMLAPADVGGEASGLAAGLCGLGLRPTLALARADPWREPAHPARRFASPLARRLFALAAPLRFDVLHFFFGRTLYHSDETCDDPAAFHPDLALARSLGRRLFMTLQGCDARDPSSPADDASPCREGGCRHRDACRARRDARRRVLFERILPACRAVFCLNPDLVLHAGPRARFLPYAGIDVERLPAAPPPRASGPLRILHAPTDRGIKGTPLIEAAVAELASSRAVELTVVEGRPRGELLGRLARADLVIDQVRIGWYGSLAVEAMALGRPVAAYLRDADLAALPPGMRAALPVLRVKPASLADDLSRILDRRAAFPALGDASREFARTWHDPARVARTVLDAYLD